MSIRELPSGRFVLNLAGFYLGSYPTESSAKIAEAKLEPLFERAKAEIEQEAVEHAIEKCMFRQSANTLKDRSAALGRAIQKMEKRI